MVEDPYKQAKEIRRAVALQYDPQNMHAPHVAASGRGFLAERIITLAQENRIPIIEENALVKVLGNLSLGEEVPSELYEAVAAIYAFIMEADQRKGL